MDREQLTANAATHANASLTAQTVYGTDSPEHQKAQETAAAAVTAALNAGVSILDIHRQADSRL